MRTASLLALVLVPYAAAQDRPTEVAVLGAIHGDHLKSERYSVETVIRTIRNYKPDVVFVEVPPDLYAESVEKIDRKGFATTRKDLAGLRWIGSFPEIYRGVVPLRKELGYAVEPVSGWTPDVSEDRRRHRPDPKLKRIHDRVRASLREIQERENDRENPAFLNSQHYADLRQLERTLWAACFDEGLGRGGEVRINEAHFANIARALDRHRGKRVLIVYGAAHRYWFLRELRRRDNVKLVDVAAFLP